MIDQGVTAALEARDALRSTNGDDSHNSRTGTVGHEAAYGMYWKTLMKMMTDKYCPRNEIRKLEMELWELKVNGTDLASYTQRFQELALLCGRIYKVMSDSEESGVTYTDISSPFEGLSDIGSPRADDHEYLMKAPPSPDYMPGPEEPEQAPLSPDYIPGLEHADDEIVAEDQPYAEDASPIAQSPEYVPESDFEMHPEDDDDEDPEEDPVDYPADGGDDGDDEEESSEDEEDDQMDVEADEEEEEEEHPAPADSEDPEEDLVDYPADGGDDGDDEKESSEDEEDDEIDIPFPPLPSILSPPSPVLSPAPPPSPIRSLGYRAVMIRLRDEAASTSSPTSQLPSASRREDRPEGAPVSTDTELGEYVREFETRVRQDTDEIYTRLDDKQTERQLLAALQGQVTALQVHVTTLQGQQGLARDHTQSELPEEAGGSA
nr:reverse transcriptase domain-containing protein [Tanacetum cinerariifolium]